MCAVFGLAWNMVPEMSSRRKVAGLKALYAKFAAIPARAEDRKFQEYRRSSATIGAHDVALYICDNPLV